MVARFLCWLIRVYQRIHVRFLPPVCIYQPTCSHYTLQAIRTRGAVVGLYMGMRRIMRCHPWARGGYDPVPPLPGEQLRDHAQKSASSSGKVSAKPQLEAPILARSLSKGKKRGASRGRNIAAR